MQIYLPIAELPVNIFLLFGLGGLGGILAGMFGIGGGFLITPLLMFIGIPPTVAVATSTNQIIASSLSGFLAHWYRNNVDLKMGFNLLVGGLLGSSLGVWLFATLKTLGQIDLVISISYVIFLGFIGILMGIESSRSVMKKRAADNDDTEKKINSQGGNVGLWLRSIPLPMQAYFPRSELHISIFLPIIIGTLAGIIVSILGMGGGFIMIPAMIYLLGMPTGVVVGTSLFTIVFTTGIATVLHAVNTQAVDIVLGFILILGGVIGAQIGTVIGLKIPADRLRVLLALMVLAVCIRLGLELVLEPDNLFEVITILE